MLERLVLLKITSKALKHDRDVTMPYSKTALVSLPQKGNHVNYGRDNIGFGECPGEA